MWVISTEKITSGSPVDYEKKQPPTFKDSHDPAKTNRHICSGRPEQPKSLQSQWQFQMSHIEVCPSACFCSFTGTHTLSRAEMLRLACGHRRSSSEVTTALISFSLQVILDPCPAIRNLHKEMKSRRRTLQNLVSLQGDPLSIVNESKLNHKGLLHNGQIFQLAVKSYLRLTGCDGRKWCVVTVVETAALLLQSCLHDAQVVVSRRKPALRNIKLYTDREWRFRFLNLNKWIKQLSSWHPL